MISRVVVDGQLLPFVVHCSCVLSQIRGPKRLTLLDVVVAIAVVVVVAALSSEIRGPKRFTLLNAATVVIAIVVVTPLASQEINCIVLLLGRVRVRGYIRRSGRR